MGSLSFMIGMGLFACATEVGSGEGDELSAVTTSELFGCVSESRKAPFVQATARIHMADGGFCSGTLVTPNQVLSAAHCFCDSRSGAVVFAGDNGQVEAGARQWPILDVAIPENAKLCGPVWADSSKDDPAYHQPFDIALVTIGPDAQGLPPVTPSPMFLGDVRIAQAAGILGENVWAVGYGKNAPSPWDPSNESCPGCGVRRSGPIGEVVYKNDECSSFIFPLEKDCFDAPLWVAKSISKGNFSEPAQGDSGGGLFFNVDIACTNSNQGTQAPGLLAGVLSAWHSSSENRSRWAPLDHSAQFICDNLSVPVSRTQRQQRADGVTAKRRVEINDRAQVVAPGNRTAAISAGEQIVLGADALVGEAYSSGSIWLRERAIVERVVQATRNIISQNHVTVGQKQEGVCTKIEPFSFDPAFSAGTHDRVFVHSGSDAFLDVHLSPGDDIRDLTVRDRVRVHFAPGLYVFRDLDLAPGAVLNIPDNTWIYLMGEAEQKFRGTLEGNAGSIFWGIPRARSVVLGGEWRGALVAPRAHVVGDMVEGAILVGNFFVDSFTLHQGRVLLTVPFLGSWIPTCDAWGTNCE